MANIERTNDDHISRATASLSDELPTTALALKDVLREAHASYTPIVQARVEAQAKLYTERLRFRHPKDKELTDWDRKIMLDAHTSEAQRKYELLAGIEKALEQRIAVIQTLLAK